MAVAATTTIQSELRTANDSERGDIKSLQMETHWKLTLILLVKYYHYTSFITTMNAQVASSAREQTHMPSTHEATRKCAVNCECVSRSVNE